MQTSTREKGLGHFFPFIALSATIEGNLAKYGIVVQSSKEMVGLQTSTREKGVRHSLPFSLFFCSHGAVFVPRATALASSVHVLRCSETPALYEDHREHAKTQSQKPGRIVSCSLMCQEAHTSITTTTTTTTIAVSVSSCNRRSTIAVAVTMAVVV